MRRIKFRPKLRDTVRIHAAYLAAMSPAGKMADDLQASHDHLVSGFPKMRQHKVRDQAEKRAISHEPNSDFPGVDIDSIHQGKRAAPKDREGQVLTDVGKLLKNHPDVLMALRFNGGAVHRQTAEGDFVPMWFHRWIKRPEQMRLVDYFGLLAYKNAGKWWTRPLAIECKEPLWTLPRNLELKSYVREKEQKAFMDMIRSQGGKAGFARSVAEAKLIIES